MLHICVTVIGEDPEGQLALFDRSLSLPAHMVYSKDDLVAEERQYLSLLAGYRREWEEHPAAYENEHTPANVRLVATRVPAMLRWTDGQCHRHALRAYLADIRRGATYCEVRPDGSVWETSGHRGKWDSRVLGGRWDGSIRTTSGSRCNQSRVCDIADTTTLGSAVVVKDGRWYERGYIGWWSRVKGEREEAEAWDAKLRTLFSGLSSDTLISVYDCQY